MRVVRQHSGRPAPYLGAYVGGALVVGAFLAALWIRLDLPRPICIFKEWTGLPCPTCGATRMIEALLSGEILAAASWNPLLFAGLAALALWAAASTARLLLGLPAWKLVTVRWERIGLRIFAVGALALCWIYLIGREQLF
jgi:hypothetical protein